MDTKALLKKVRKIEIKTRRLSDNVFGGEYHSTFKGRGMTFSEVRQYQYGDDVRAIDWNVTARYQEPFVKVFEEERELTLLLAVDISGSAFFGTQQQYKKEILIEIAATLAFSALQNNDKVGLILFSQEIELYIPPKKGRSHILRLIREMLEFEPKQEGTSINRAYEFVSAILKKKAIVFLLSDFISTEDYEKTLRIAAKKHDLTSIRLYDPREASIPNIGLVPMLDSETGKMEWINTHSKRLRWLYETKYKRHAYDFSMLHRANGAGAIDCSVNESYVKKLLSYFKARG
ncbi:MAG: DUF58 domain-containing protein [Flavobacteriaceae bacterium]